MQDENLSTASIKQTYQLINRLYNWATEMDMYEGPNPCKKVKVKQPDNQVNTFLSTKEIKRMTEVCNNWPNQRTAQLFMFILHTGMRVQEATHLRWQDVDFKRQFVTITKNKDQKQARYLPISNEAVAILRKVEPNAKGEYVFSTHTGDRMHYPTKTWKRIKAEADLPNYRIHDLRHTFASHLASQGVSLYHIQKLLGHTTPIMTQRYAHLTDESLKGAVQNFDYGES